MKFPRVAMNIPLAMVASTFLMIALQAQAETVGGVPSVPEPVPITPHQGKALREALAAETSAHQNLLTGRQEVPAVKTSAKGKASITIAADKTVTGGISTSGIVATAAHIHAAATGKNGPVVITLAKDGENRWIVPADSSLTAVQYETFKAGGLYVNVHSAVHGAGEIRAQLKP